MQSEQRLSGAPELRRPDRIPVRLGQNRKTLEAVARDAAVAESNRPSQRFDEAYRRRLVITSLTRDFT